ncbi:hypothetical protein PV328_008319 [Microctonus aethiopoides]|uniref:Uncharacterized protein n=1 Tax=Microctonus aethiopoides TaxID=144406 RepID=A0AA39CAK0_9HYME|nr:hypothetical protein PV328_008319 [Microctonus aethiopoides]
MSNMPRVTIIYQLTFLMIIGKHQVESIVGAISDITTVANFANDALSVMKGEISLEDLILDSTGNALDTIIEKMNNLTRALDDMEANNERRMDHMLETIMTRIPLENRVDTGLTELHHYIVRIDGMYEDFQHYQKNAREFSRSTIRSFIDSVISHKKGDIQDTLDSMHHLMKPGRSASYRKPLPELVHQRNQMMSFEELCGMGSSPQQRLYEICLAVLGTEFKAFTMNYFSYLMLMTYTKELYKGEKKRAAAQLITKSQSYLITIKRAMKDSSRIVDNCDPKKFERGINFVELEGAMQMFIVGEVHIGSSISSNRCWDTCMRIPYHPGLINFDCSEKSGNMWCPIRNCYGRLYDCESASSTTVCELGRDSLRRYEWVKDNYGNTYGNSSSCAGRIKHPDYYTLGFSSCDVCLCTCADESSNSNANRTINLRPQLSNIKKNMIVIGARFTSSDNIIHIQIRVGKLIPDGLIAKGTEQWIEPEKFFTEKNKNLKNKEMGSVYLIEGDKKRLLKPDNDFSFITYDHRRMSLDELDAPIGYIVTGVKLEHESDDSRYDRLIAPIQLAIRLTKFNFINGKLCNDDQCSYWMSQENMPNRSKYYTAQRTLLALSNSDNPTKGKKHTKITGKSYYVEFHSSDRKKDAGQSTIPFFDAQQISSSQSSPLSGLGLVHRGAEGSGGFLTFRLMTLDYSHYLNTELPSNIIDKLQSKITL